MNVFRALSNWPGLISGPFLVGVPAVRYGICTVLVSAQLGGYGPAEPWSSGVPLEIAVAVRIAAFC